MAYHIIYAAAYNTFLWLILLCCAHLNRKVALRSFLWANLGHQSLSSKSGILWIYGAVKTTGNSEKNKAESWSQRSSGWSFRKRPKFLTLNFELDDCSKHIFPVWAHFFQSSQLSWIQLNFQMFWKHHKSCWIDSMVNVECLCFYDWNRDP